MINGRISLTEEGVDHLSKVIEELNMERPDVIRIAFSKGLREFEGIPEDKGGKKTFTFPINVLGKTFDFVLYKHLIIDKIRKKIEDEDLLNYLRLYIEEGLRIMSDEIDELTNLDNYLLKLVEKSR